jgi:hypothetical protein
MLPRFTEKAANKLRWKFSAAGHLKVLPKDRGRICILLAFLVWIPLTSFAGQNYLPPLERSISIQVKNIPLSDALDRIAAQGKFSFSYNSKIFKGDEKIS